MIYNFKKLEFIPGEKLWLSEIYKADFTEVDLDQLKVKLWDKLPRDFNHESIDKRLLLEGRRITLLGIWYTDKKSKYLKWTHMAIENIIDGIKSGEVKDKVTASFLEKNLDISLREAEIAIKLIYDLGGFFGGGSGTKDGGMTHAGFFRNGKAYDEFLRYKALEDKLERFFLDKAYINKNYIGNNHEDMGAIKHNSNSKKNWPWTDINTDYGLTKKKVGVRLKFIEDSYKRKVLFRDIEQAYLLSLSGYYKSSVLLAGGVIEELLRLYLISNQIKVKRNNFDSYLRLAGEYNILKAPISNLSDSVRCFRNYVHLEKESKKTDSLTMANAKSAISSMFLLIDSFT